MKTLAHPLPIVRPRRMVTKSSLDPVEMSKTIGKGLTLWVFFTSSLNWMHYRSMTRKAETPDDTKDTKRKNVKKDDENF